MTHSAEGAHQSPVRRLQNGMRAFSNEGHEIGRVASVGEPGGQLHVLDESGKSLWVERARITAIGGDYLVMRIGSME